MSDSPREFEAPGPGDSAAPAESPAAESNHRHHRHSEDDIAAIATPPGRGAIGVVRLSGPNVPALARALLGRLPAPRVATLCDFTAADGEAIDRGLALYFPAPKSYTGEHLLELHGHGGQVVMKMLLGRCLELGARPARPGEFSARAFLNGRLDLAQAEAVADLIESATEAAARSAMHSLQGEFSARIRGLVDGLTALRVFVEAAIDFPDEDIDFLADERIMERLRDLQTRIKTLRDSAKRGRLLRDGFTVALTGPPNAGKSSLLNALACAPRAIVSAIPGTTRDVVDATVEIDGLGVQLIDSAGLRDAADAIEAEGVRRALAAQRDAGLVLLVVDDAAVTDAEVAMLRSQVGGGDGDGDAISRHPRGPLSGGGVGDAPAPPVCLVRNKIDISGRAPGAIDGDGDGDGGGVGNAESGIAVSALNGAGLDDLRAAILAHADFRDSEDNAFIARQRHLDALARAAAQLDAAAAQPAGELLAEDLAACQRSLGEITGEVTNDELLGMIFASFCIGK